MTLSTETLEKFLELGEKIETSNYTGIEQCDFWLMANQVAPQAVRELMKIKKSLNEIINYLEIIKPGLKILDLPTEELEFWMEKSKRYLGE